MLLSNLYYTLPSSDEFNRLKLVGYGADDRKRIARSNSQDILLL